MTFDFFATKVHRLPPRGSQVITPAQLLSSSLSKWEHPVENFVSLRGRGPLVFINGYNFMSTTVIKLWQFGDEARKSLLWLPVNEGSHSFPWLLRVVYNTFVSMYCPKGVIFLLTDTIYYSINSIYIRHLCCIQSMEVNVPPRRLPVCHLPFHIQDREGHVVTFPASTFLKNVSLLALHWR